MPLSNSQYDEILRSYDARQLAHQRLLEARTKEAYERLPRLKEIDDAIASCSVAQAKRLFDGDNAALSTLHGQLAAYRSEKAALLKEHGFPADYFTPPYALSRLSGYRIYRDEPLPLLHTGGDIMSLYTVESQGDFKNREFQHVLLRI